MCFMQRCWFLKCSEEGMLGGGGLLVHNEILYIIVPRRLFFYCPKMNSNRPKSQVTSKEQALIPEKELRRTWPRCYVSLEKSSKNQKPLEKWANSNLSPDVTPRLANFYGEYFPRICHVVKPDPPELFAVLTRHPGWPKKGRGRGDLRFDIAH